MANSKGRNSGIKWLVGIVIFLGIAVIGWLFLKNDLKKSDSKVKKKLTAQFKRWLLRQLIAFTP
jgi:hypothetical protein